MKEKQHKKVTLKDDCCSTVKAIQKGEHGEKEKLKKTTKEEVKEK